MRSRLIPPLLFLVLAIPCVGLSYLSDDYAFVLRAWNFHPAQLLPDPESGFWRPISRELYFGLLTRISPNNPLWGHILNWALAAASVSMVAEFARRVAGARVGFFTGMLFAATAVMPTLVAWVCCSQDLLALAFLAAALLLQQSGRVAAALVCAAAALLSKESAIFFLPGLAALRWILNGDRRLLRQDASKYAVLLAAWAIANPRARTLLRSGFASGEGGYVGLDNPDIGQHWIRMAATHLNLPSYGFGTPWPSHLNVVMLAAAFLIAVAYWLDRSRRLEAPSAAVPRRRILLLGLGLGVIPGFLVAASARHWFPYYACLPAVGISLVLADMIVRFGRRACWAALAFFFLLGIWYRGTVAGKASIPTEANFREMSSRLNTLEAGLKKLHPELPDSSRLYFTVQAPDETYLQFHLWDVQAPRVWYGNSTLVSFYPERYKPGARPEFLFWVTADGSVFEITLPELRVRSPGLRPSQAAYQRAIRNFSLGLFGAGEVDRAVRAVLSMQERSEFTRAFDRRLAAAFLFATGRDAEAAGPLQGLPPLSREEALDAVAVVIGPHIPGADLDDGAFRAFGLVPGDAEAYRYLMNMFSEGSFLPQAMRMARRLLSVKPGDEEAMAMVEAIEKIPRWEQVFVPIEGRGR